MRSDKLKKNTSLDWQMENKPLAPVSS